MNTNKNFNEILDQDIELTQDRIDELKEGLDELITISDNTKFEAATDSTTSSFKEAFPNYNYDKYKGVDPSIDDKTAEKAAIYDKLEIDEIHKKIENSEILKILFGTKNIEDIKELFNKTLNSSDEERIELISLIKVKLLKLLINTNTNGKPLGEFGEITINEAIDRGVNIIKPLLPGGER